MSTLSKLVLGSEPTSVTVRDDQLLVGLADGRSLAISLSLIGQLEQDVRLSAETQLLILHKPPQVDYVHVTDSALNVYFKDGRMLSSPLAWFPRLLHGTPAERHHYLLANNDDVIHWPSLDENIEISRLFEGGKSTESKRSFQRWLATRLTSTATKAAAD